MASSNTRNLTLKKKHTLSGVQSGQQGSQLSILMFPGPENSAEGLNAARWPQFDQV